MCHWACLYLIRLTANIINNCGRKRVKEKMKERGRKGADRELYNKLLYLGHLPLSLSLPPSLPPVRPSLHSDDCIERSTTHLHFLPLYKNEAKISCIQPLPSCALDIIWIQSIRNSYLHGIEFLQSYQLRAGPLITNALIDKSDHNWDVSASLLENCHVVCLFMQSMT